MEPQSLPYEILNPHKLALTDKVLILVNHESLQVVDLASLETLYEHELAGEEKEDYKHAPINTLVTSVNGKYLAVGDLNNNIHVCDSSFLFFSFVDCFNNIIFAGIWLGEENEHLHTAQVATSAHGVRTAAWKLGPSCHWRHW